MGLIIDIKKLRLSNLGRNRTIRVLLPPSYEGSNSRYPILYFQDGQNIFDKSHGFVAHTWGVDTFLKERWAEGTFPELIVVGIDHGRPFRLGEYSPWPYDKKLNPVGVPFFPVGGGKGKLYAEDFKGVIKPFIDQTYRTISDPHYTYLAGSSMGAYISLYLASRYKDLASKILAMSPAVWHSQLEFLQYLKKSGFSPNTQIYMDMGTKETSFALNPQFPQIYSDGAEALYSTLKALGMDEKRLHYSVIEGAKHGELAWRRRLPRAMEVLFGN